MKDYQPLVLQKLDIRVPDIHVRQLALHRHLPETTNIKPHSHAFCQCLLYLSGRGEQHVSGDIHQIETGTAVFLPPQIRHAFHRAANRRPICLVLDFEWAGTNRGSARVSPLPAAILSEVRQQLARIAHRPRRQDPTPPIRLSAMILGLLDSLLTELVLPRSTLASFHSPVARKLERLLAAPDAATISLKSLAHRAGYQHDYLNRVLKQHDGLTLGQLRARKLLARSQQLLRQTDSVADVAEVIGFGDPNYFARWFRKHTGLSPTRWRLSSGR